MKKMRCTSCGAELKVKDDKEYAICEHCGSSYKLNEDVNINIKVDDNVKEVINNGLGTAKHFSKFMLIPVGIFVLFFICGIVFAFKSEADFNKRQEQSEQEQAERQKEEEKKREEIEKQAKDAAEKAKEKAAKESFNFQFVNAAGTKNGFSLRGILDDVIESNKENERKVMVVYNGNSTTDESEIINIKHSLGEWTDYEVIVNKDDSGYINEIKIENIG